MTKSRCRRLAVAERPKSMLRGDDPEPGTGPRGGTASREVPLQNLHRLLDQFVAGYGDAQGVKVARRIADPRQWCPLSLFDSENENPGALSIDGNTLAGWLPSPDGSHPEQIIEGCGSC